MSTATTSATRIDRVFDAGSGILRLAPTWVPRVYCIPGQRIRLHPDDWYALGAHRGGIDERWLASTTPADNGPETPEGEGLSRVVDDDGTGASLRDTVEHLGAALIGERLWAAFGAWPMYSKFFDNRTPLPFHIHHRDEHAALTGQRGKPEAYYFPPQMNAIGNNFPYTFFGLEPGTTKAQIRRCLEDWNKGDNGILDLSKAYRLKPGTGWLVGPCILHAPGSLVTYEPQWGSDVFAMYQSLVEGRDVPWDLLVKDVPPDKHQDLDYIVEELDWDSNVDPNFKDNHYLEPIVDKGSEKEGYVDRWVVYGNIGDTQYFSAKELTVYPGQKCTIKDNGASGLICVQGRGRIGKLPLESPTMIRFGEMTEDEVFITAKAAQEGVEVENLANDCPLVCLRYFGPDVHSDMPEVGDYKK